MAERKSLLYRLMSSLTYVQKYGLMSLLYGLAILPLFYSLYQDYSDELTKADLKIQWNKYQAPIQKLMQNLHAFRLASLRVLSGDNSQKDLLNQAQSRVNENLRELNELNRELVRLQEKAPTRARFDVRKMEATNLITQKWNSLIEKFSELTPDTIDATELQIIDMVKNLLKDVHYTTVQYMNPKNPSYYLMTVDQTIFPDAQDFLNQLVSVGEFSIAQKKLTQAERDKIFLLMGVVNSMSESIKENIEKSYTVAAALGTEKVLRTAIDPVFADYLKSVQSFVNFVQEKLVKESEPTLSLSEFYTRGQETIDKGFRLWNTLIDEADRYMVERKAEVIRNFYLSLFAILTCLGITFLIGLWLATDASHRLAQVTVAADEITQGKLSARVPIVYLDEIGRFSVAFNKMADTIEKNIIHLKNLQQATRSLAEGTLSTRLAIDNEADEFSHVARSFNRMAETFEIIINQLKQVGVNISTSAAEIDIASKEQETIIIAQESTTKAIAVTANDISSTAKDFATTINEISRVAEDTSKLASEGRAGLSHMETVMRHMVDASGNIAAKLSVLNEKTGNITSVITTITKVADQTNLLSLNASIEAEKAGEYGRSFAVIAREIRRLAEQTAVATLDIEKIVTEIVGAVSSSVMGVDDFTQEIRAGVEQIRKVGEKLSTIIEQVQNLTTQFEMVNQGMQTQSAGAEQINEAINQLSQTAKQTSESIHQFRKTVQELDSSTQDLRRVVSQITKSEA